MTFQGISEMNEDDHKDMSIWNDFFAEHVTFFSNCLLDQMAKDIVKEARMRNALKSIEKTEDKEND